MESVEIVMGLPGSMLEIMRSVSTIKRSSPDPLRDISGVDVSSLTSIRADGSPVLEGLIKTMIGYLNISEVSVVFVAIDAGMTLLEQ